MNWSALENGDLLTAAENDGFEVLVTTDTNLRYQQNLSERQIAIVVLRTTSWPRIKANVESISAKIDSARENDYIEIDVP